MVIWFVSTHQTFGLCEIYHTLVHLRSSSSVISAKGQIILETHVADASLLSRGLPW